MISNRVNFSEKKSFAGINERWVFLKDESKTGNFLVFSSLSVCILTQKQKRKSNSLKQKAEKFTSLKCEKKKKSFKMQLKIFVLCVVLGVVSAQRGHYAGQSRPILGQRYQNENTATQSNFVTDPASPPPANRFNENSNSIVQPQYVQPRPIAYQQPNVFGNFGSGFPGNQGFPQFPFAPFGFNGRRR
jgi:hypothetical protein